MKPEMKSSFSGAAINLYKGAMGAGILATPYAFAMGGYLLAIIVFVTLSSLTIYTTLVNMKNI